jgi:hypothetical protein
MDQGRSFTLTMATILVVFGVFFLIVNLIPGGPGIDVLWPFFILIPGLLFLGPAVLGHWTGERRLAALAIPGTILTSLGLIFLFCTSTGHWAVWSYVWTLIPGSVGLGLYLAARIGRWGPMPAAVGRWMLLVALIAFLAFGVFFEAVIFGLGGRFWPVVLVLAGLLILLWNYLPRRAGTTRRRT